MNYLSFYQHFDRLPTWAVIAINIAILITFTVIGLAIGLALRRKDDDWELKSTIATYVLTVAATIPAWYYFVIKVFGSLAVLPFLLLSFGFAMLWQWPVKKLLRILIERRRRKSFTKWLTSVILILILASCSADLQGPYSCSDDFAGPYQKFVFANEKAYILEGDTLYVYPITAVDESQLAKGYTWFGGGTLTFDEPPTRNIACRTDDKISRDELSYLLGMKGNSLHLSYQEKVKTDYFSLKKKAKVHEYELYHRPDGKLNKTPEKDELIEEEMYLVVWAMGLLLISLMVALIPFGKKWNEKRKEPLCAEDYFSLQFITYVLLFFAGLFMVARAYYSCLMDPFTFAMITLTCYILFIVLHGRAVKRVRAHGEVTMKNYLRKAPTRVSERPTKKQR